MNSNYFCRKILSDDNLDHVKNIITSENIEWEDGNNTVINKVENIKKVLETFDQDVFDIIMSDLDKDVEFSSIVVNCLLLSLSSFTKSKLCCILYPAKCS